MADPIGGISALTQTLSTARLQAPAAPRQGGFAAALSEALESVNRMQGEAAEMSRGLQLEEPTVSLEDTVIAGQKAQIAFQATVQVRNRLVSAYQDVMNMQI